MHEYFNIIIEEEPSIVKYYIDDCFASLREIPWLPYICEFGYGEMEIILYLETKNIKFFQFTPQTNSFLINILQRNKNDDLIDFVLQQVLNTTDENLELVGLICPSVDSDLFDRVLENMTTVSNYNRIYEVCKYVGSFYLENDGNILIQEIWDSEKHRSFLRFICLYCCLGFIDPIRRYIDQYTYKMAERHVSLPHYSLRIVETTFSGGTTLFADYLADITSPVTFLNAIFTKGEKDDENDLYKIAFFKMICVMIIF